MINGADVTNQKIKGSTLCLESALAYIKGLDVEDNF